MDHCLEYKTLRSDKDAALEEEKVEQKNKKAKMLALTQDKKPFNSLYKLRVLAAVECMHTFDVSRWFTLKEIQASVLKRLSGKTQFAGSEEECLSNVKSMRRLLCKGAETDTASRLWVGKEDTVDKRHKCPVLNLRFQLTPAALEQYGRGLHRLPEDLMMGSAQLTPAPHQEGRPADAAKVKGESSGKRKQVDQPRTSAAAGLSSNPLSLADPIGRPRQTTFGEDAANEKGSSGAAIAWAIKKQRSIGLSSDEAEGVAGSEAACQSVAIRGLLEDLRIIQHGPTTLDNTAAIDVSDSASVYACESDSDSLSDSASVYAYESDSDSQA